MRRFRDIPIRGKLTAIIVTTFSIAMLVGGLALTARYAAGERDKLIDRLTVLATVIGTNTSAALVFNDRSAARDTLGALVAEPSILNAYVHDSRGRLFARFDAPGARTDGVEDLQAADGGVLFGTPRLSVSSPIVLDGERIGTVFLNADLQPVRSAFLRDLGIFGLITLAASVVALALSAVLREIVSAPILGLAQAMKRVSQEKDYSVRAEKQCNDEVGSLIDGFNEMLGQIRGRDEELRLAYNAMESTGDSIMITNGRLRVVWVNRAFTTMTGYGPEEVLGQRPRLLRSDRHELTFYRKIWKRVAAVGQWHGEIWGRRKNGEVFPQWVTVSEVTDDAGNATHYVLVSNDISQYKNYEARLEFLAHHDALTQLPNRALFHAQLQEMLLHARRKGEILGLMFVDLDRFKPINDTLGHAVGDRLLVAAAGRLKGCLRESDMVARMGGDEFTVLLDGLKHIEDAAIIAQKVAAEISRPFEIAGNQLSISASIGIACYPYDGDDAETLLRNADSAMYAAKEQGRNGFRFHHRATEPQGTDAARDERPPCSAH